MKVIRNLFKFTHSDSALKLQASAGPPFVQVALSALESLALGLRLKQHLAGNPFDPPLEDDSPSPPPRTLP